MRKTLRAALGCEHVIWLELSLEERRHCQDQLASRQGAGVPQFNPDPLGRYYSDPNQEPYLVRKPKNGCKIRAAGDHTVNGDGAAAGVTCGKTF